MNRYANQMKPEEIILGLNENDNATDAEILKELKNAMHTNKTLSGYCIQCDEDGSLEIQLGERIKGIIAREEVTYRVEKDGLVHLGKCQGRVGLYVPFKVKHIKLEEDGSVTAILSRKEAVEEVRQRYVKELKVGDVVDGVVIGIQGYAAWLDIGGDVSGILSIRDITRVPIAHPSEILKVGQAVTVVVTEVEAKPEGGLTISFSRKELLPKFEEIDKYFKQGTTVLGRVKKIWDTGVFIELSEAFEGLADFVPGKTFKYGDKVRVKIELIDKKRTKIKLRIIG